MSRFITARAWCCVALTLLLMVNATGVAAAQEDGVHYDPDSPAGKEYALPLDRARAQGDVRATRSADDADAGLFGQGISKSTTTTTPSQSAARDARSGGAADGRRKSAVSGSGTSVGDGPMTPATEPAVSESGGSGLAVGAGIALAVLGGGLVLSFVLRRGRPAVTE
jgi:hypothetical protein